VHVLNFHLGSVSGENLEEKFGAFVVVIAPGFAEEILGFL
jgi:hypothetical protein